MENKDFYYSLNKYYREKFGQKTVKLSLDAGFTCPNRDGKISSTGCVFCSAKGSGDFAGSRQMSITEQLESQKQLISAKWKKCSYIAYFQAFTNTYAPIEELKRKYYEALSCDDVVGISVATRPDCIDEDIAKLLFEISKRYYVCVELGLQTSNEKTADYINRGYKNDVFEMAVNILKKYNIETVCHIIFGLPHETRADMLNSVKYVSDIGIDGIKIQLLHVLKDTPLADIYYNEGFHILSKEEYIDTVIEAIKYIPENIVIHRLTGDGPKKLLIEPKWSLNKKDVLNLMNKKMAQENLIQGSLCISSEKL